MEKRILIVFLVSALVSGVSLAGTSPEFSARSSEVATKYPVSSEEEKKLGYNVRFALLKWVGVEEKLFGVMSREGIVRLARHSGLAEYRRLILTLNDADERIMAVCEDDSLSVSNKGREIWRAWASIWNRQVIFFNWLRDGLSESDQKVFDQVIVFGEFFGGSDVHPGYSEEALGILIEEFPDDARQFVSDECGRPVSGRNRVFFSWVQDGPVISSVTSIGRFIDEKQ